MTLKGTFLRICSLTLRAFLQPFLTFVPILFANEFTTQEYARIRQPGWSFLRRVKVGKMGKVRKVGKIGKYFLPHLHHLPHLHQLVRDHTPFVCRSVTD